MRPTLWVTAGIFNFNSPECHLWHRAGSPSNNTPLISFLPTPFPFKLFIYKALQPVIPIFLEANPIISWSATFLRIATTVSTSSNICLLLCSISVMIIVDIKYTEKEVVQWLSQH